MGLKADYLMIGINGERDKDRPNTHNHQLDKSGAGLIERIILSTFPLGRESEQFEASPLVQVA